MLATSDRTDAPVKLDEARILEAIAEEKPAEGGRVCCLRCGVSVLVISLRKHLRDLPLTAFGVQRPSEHGWLCWNCAVE